MIHLVYTWSTYMPGEGGSIAQGGRGWWRGVGDTFIHIYTYTTRGEVVKVPGLHQFSVYIAVRSVILGGQLRFGSVRCIGTEPNRTEIDRQKPQTEPLCIWRNLEPWYHLQPLLSLCTCMYICLPHPLPPYLTPLPPYLMLPPSPVPNRTEPKFTVKNHRPNRKVRG